MTTDLDLAYRSAVDVAGLVASGELSPVDLVDNALARIAAVQPALNCFTAVWGDEARAEARVAADEVARAGRAGEPLPPLHGVPIAMKETTHVAGRPLTLGSWTHEHVIADRDAAITAALRRAGAIVVGATTSPEFAHTLQTDSPRWGVTRNPWNLGCTPGGSSGGSAAAVAAAAVYLAEGSDMGGSVRIPAAWCGTIGLKPGIGRIPMDVLPGLFDSLSHHGPLARTVEDARRFLAVTQGPDEADIQSVTTPLDLSGPTPSDVRGMRIALTLDYGTWFVHPEVRAAVLGAADALRDAGAIVDEIDHAASGPLFVEADEIALWIPLWGVFMSAYFGHHVAEYGERMDPDVLGLIRHGESLSATDYKRLEIARTAVWHRVAAAMAGYDVLLCPTMATPAISAAKADRAHAAHPADGRFHAEDMTSVWNLVAPCPAMSVPCGVFAESTFAGMPIGLQIVGHRWREDTVLRVGRAIELALPAMSGRRPPV